MKQLLLALAAVALLTVPLVWTFADETEVTEQDFAAFLHEYEAKVIPLSKEEALSYFKAMVSGSDADYEKSAQATIALERLRSDTAAFARLKAFRESGQVSDPLLKRQLDMLYLSFLGCQIDPAVLEELVRRQSAIEQKFNTSRTVVGGEALGDNQVDYLLRSSTDAAELETVWAASKEIGRTLAPDIIELVRLRNRAAVTLGFANYYEMQLTLAEQNPGEIAVLFDGLDELTRDAFVVLKGEIDSALSLRYHISPTELRPWHYQNRFFQEAPGVFEVDMSAFYRGRDPVELSRRYFAGVGIPVDSILAGSDLYEKPGKYQHAQCVDIDRAGDVRVLASVRPDYYWTNTMLHELGHGVYDFYTSPGLPWHLRGAAHSVTTEAVALFFGRLSGNPLWLEKVAGVPKAEIDPVASECLRMQRTEQLVFSRWCQVMVRFERALYEDPDQDLNRLWWDLVEKYQLLKRPAGRNEPDWAAKIHLATTPVYYHNYQMGELLASQFAYALGSKVLGSADPFAADFATDRRVGKFFVERVFQPGAAYFWNDMVEKATGEKLTPVYFARQFVDVR